MAFAIVFPNKFKIESVAPFDITGDGGVKTAGLIRGVNELYAEFTAQPTMRRDGKVPIARHLFDDLLTALPESLISSEKARYEEWLAGIEDKLADFREEDTTYKDAVKAKKKAEETTKDPKCSEEKRGRAVKTLRETEKKLHSLVEGARAELKSKYPFTNSWQPSPDAKSIEKFRFFLVRFYLIFEFHRRLYVILNRKLKKLDSQQPATTLDEQESTWDASIDDFTCKPFPNLDPSEEGVLDLKDLPKFYFEEFFAKMAEEGDIEYYGSEDIPHASAKGFPPKALPADIQRSFEEVSASFDQLSLNTLAEVVKQANLTEVPVPVRKWPENDEDRKKLSKILHLEKRRNTHREKAVILSNAMQMITSSEHVVFEVMNETPLRQHLNKLIHDRHYYGDDESLSKFIENAPSVLHLTAGEPLFTYEQQDVLKRICKIVGNHGPYGRAPQSYLALRMDWAKEVREQTRKPPSSKEGFVNPSNPLYKEPFEFRITGEGVSRLKSLTPLS